MRTIGLLGGMSWESTATYYRALNEEVRARLGGLHSARIVLNSVDFAEIERLQRRAQWDEAGCRLAAAARQVELAGADFLLLCTNTMHKVAPIIERHVRIPLLHIADATADEIARHEVGCVGLLGTRFTMEQPFYAERLSRAHGLRVLVPEVEGREMVDHVIYEELCRGVSRDESRRRYAEVMARLADRGAEGIVLGCTEIALLVDAADTNLPMFDTTTIHARAAVNWALAESLR